MTERRKSRLVTDIQSASRQMNRERRALADFRLDRQSCVMTGQYMLDDRKAKPGAFLGAAVFDIDAVAALGDARNVFFGNARTIVPYRDVEARLLVILAAGNRYGDAPA